MKTCEKCGGKMKLSIIPLDEPDYFSNCKIRLVCTNCGFVTSNLSKYAEPDEKEIK